MKLFAPLDIGSERGSIRAPSPSPEDDEDDEDDEPGVEDTPRPQKPDPLSAPTPKVTGAYVETPATVKIASKAERFESEPVPLKSEPLKPLSTTSVASFLHGRPSGSGKPDDTKSESGRKKNARSTSISTLQRSRSVPRNRSQLFNSAKPPSARDDLLKIQRMHQMDDSTQDDLDDLLDPHGEGKMPTPPPEDRKERVTAKVEPELEAYDRLSKSLKNGLLGIQTAKRGIERLEDKVSHADDISPPSHHEHKLGTSSEACALCAGHPPSATVTYVHLPLPRLYYREPEFRLSLLGLLLVLLTTWLVAESTMCSYYCRPSYCVGGQDCTWSPDDPFFGYAVPVKLDQWATGGQGRALANRVLEEMDDAFADAWDLITGTDIARVDTQYFTFEQKRQHRRRLWKKGLAWTPKDPPQQKAKLDAWRTARQARDRARSAREMGYDIGDGLGDDSMASDEKLSRW